MSKTLGSVLLIGAAIAVNVIPGAGQFLSAALLNVGLSIGTAVAVSGAITTGLTLAGAAAGLQAGASLLGLGPKAPKAEQTQGSIKSPTPARVHANGPRRLYGAYLFYGNSPEGNAVDVVAFSDSRMGTVLQVYLNDDKVTVSGGVVQAGTDKRYQRGRVLVGWNVGLPTETAFPAVMANLPGIWTATHRGDGVATGYLIKYLENQKNYTTTFPQGDQIQLSIAAEWGLHFDPRDLTQDAYDPETWVYSENAAVQFLTYLIKFRSLDWDTQGEPTRAIIEAALNDCDDTATGEPRYRAAVVHKATDEPAAIISEYLSCFDGWYCFNESNHLILYSGRYYTPTVTLTPAQIRGYRDSGGTPVEDRINEIKLTYISPEHDYADVECTAWRDEDAILESGREPNTTQLSIQSTSFTQNRRLAKRMMARINAADKFTISTTYGGQSVMGQRYIWLKIKEGTYTGYDGPVEILTAPETDLQTGGVSFECCTVDPNIDAWNPATEDGEGAPTGAVVTREPLDTPTISSAFVVYDFSVDNAGTGARIQAEIDTDIEGATWFARTRVGSGVWSEQEYTDSDPSAGVVTLLTNFVPIAAAVDVEVSYRSSDGRYSDWSATVEVDTRTDQTPPDAAVAITLTSWADALNLSTDAIPRASSYRWRFYDPSDLSTPLRTIVTPTRTVSYTSSQAAIDGVRRSYVATVAGVNAAGPGSEASTSTITNDAPSAVTGVSATGGATTAEIAYTPLGEPDVAGYVAYVSVTDGFNPETQGDPYYGVTPIIVQGLAAGTFYTRVAAFDLWSQNPLVLNFSAQDDFAISAGGGGSGGGGSGGNCPYVDTLVLMANAERNGAGLQKRAGDIAVGDWVWTQPELDTATLGEWGAYEVSHITIHEEPVWSADIGASSLIATPDHRIWLGGGWVKLNAIGSPHGSAMVAKITVAGAATYSTNGFISHNLKPINPDEPL